MSEEAEKRLHSVMDKLFHAPKPKPNSPRFQAHDLKQQSVDKAMEFDPIWQHRHFCPWVAAAGTAAPGWRQTLSALQHSKDFSNSSPPIIKVDDPIASVRKIFISSSAKRKRTAHGLT